MNRILLGFAAFALLACGDPPSSRVPSPHEAPLLAHAPGQPSSLPSNVVSPSGDEEAEQPREDPDRVVPPEALPPFAPAITQNLGAEGVRRLEVAASVCGAAVKPDAKGKLRVGCRSCAPFTREYGPDGTVAVLEEKDTFYELEHATFGSFTRAGVDEVAAVLAGCEPYAGNYGGTLIAERKEKGSPIWVARSYRSGLHPISCEPLALPEGRQLLACHWVTGKQITTSYLDVYDFSRGSEEDVSETITTAFEVYEDVYSACFGGRPPGHSIHSGWIDRFSVQASKTVGEIGAVALEVTHGSAKTGPAFDAACKKMIAALDSTSGKRFDLAATIPKKKHRFTLVWNGSTLVLDDEGAKRWGALQPAESDE